MTKNVTIVWGAITPWNAEKSGALSVRLDHIRSKVQSGATTDVNGKHLDDYNTVVREWIDQAAAEEEVAYVRSFAQTYGLDLISVDISDPV